MYALWTIGTTTRESNPSIILNSTTPTRSRYIFKGWTTSSTVTTVNYNPSTAYTFSENIILYAVWAEDQASIKIKVNGSWVKAKGVYIKQSGTWKKGS